MTRVLRPTSAIVSLVLLPAICAIAWGQTGPNLVDNPGADAGAGAPTGYEIVPVPNWLPTSGFTAVPWDLPGGFPTSSDPGPADRGANFFSGGSNNQVSTASQEISVAAYAALIDGGGCSYALSGWLGGYASQSDHATLAATFRDGSGAALATVSIGPVTVSDRGSATGLLFRSTNGLLPGGTRSALLVLTMTRFVGSYNDGYADSLSFTLGTAATVADLGGGCGAGTPNLASTAPMLGQAFTLSIAGAAPNAFGEVLLSGPTAPPFPIGGCTVFIDLAGYLSLFPVATGATGASSFSLVLPGGPGLAGMQLILQAYVAPSAGPLGLDLTNGLFLVLNP